MTTLRLFVIVCVLFWKGTSAATNANPFELFNCTLYESTCSHVTGYEPYPYCVGTVVNNPVTMTCRIASLQAAVAGSATNECLNAGPTGGSACSTEILRPVAAFNCENYHSVCNHWSAYPDCFGTVAANVNSMFCRETMLNILWSLSPNSIHMSSEGFCLPSSQLQKAPCDQEVLNPPRFDCDTYTAVCGATAGYKAYSNCKGTAAVNAGGMTCRSKYLRHALNIGGPDPDYYYAVYETPKFYYTALGGGLPGGPEAHCPIAGPDPVGPCKDEALDPVADFDCDLYASACSSSTQYPDCYGTVASNPGGMTCRIAALAVGDCDGASPDATGSCAAESLDPTTFDCELYASTCSSIPGYEAYDDCPSVVAYNLPFMTCRHKALTRARDPKYGAGGPAKHCPAAGPTSTGACVDEVIGKAVFDCSLYESLCAGTLGYQAYSYCQGTVESNPRGMLCRARQLALAAAKISHPSGLMGRMSVVDDTHCFNAGPVPSSFRMAPGLPYRGTYSYDVCKDEILKSVFFDCSLYESTCKDLLGYQPYSNCADVIRVNKMSCRMKYLQRAALSGGAAENCRYAGPSPTGPCESETLKLFDCQAYVTACSLVPHYQPYANCELTVSWAGADGMPCRVWALEQALADVGSIGWEEASTESTWAISSHRWCPEASPASNKCAHEKIQEPFNCKLYASTCGGIRNYQAYTHCDEVVGQNARGMACRIQALGKAAQIGGAEEYCPQAQFYAIGACASEALIPSPSQATPSHDGQVRLTNLAPQCTSLSIFCFAMLISGLG